MDEEIGELTQSAHADVLVPYAEHTVDFYGEPIVVALIHAGDTVGSGSGDISGEEPVSVVAMRTFTDYLGLDWSSQRQRIERDDVLATEVRRVLMTGADGKQREMLALPLEFLPGFLFGVQSSRVRPEHRDKLMQYRRSCFRVLWRHMQAELLYSQARSLATPQALEVAEQLDLVGAVELLLQEHLAGLLRLPSQVEDLAELVNQTAAQTAALIASLGERQQATDARLAIVDMRTKHLTPSQERQVQRLVDHLVRETKRCPAPLTYASVYGAIKRRFQVASFKEVADDRFNELMAFLQDLFVRVTKGTEPIQDRLF